PGLHDAQYHWIAFQGQGVADAYVRVVYGQFVEPDRPVAASAVCGEDARACVRRRWKLVEMQMPFSQHVASAGGETERHQSRSSIRGQGSDVRFIRSE